MCAFERLTYSGVNDTCVYLRDDHYYTYLAWLAHCSTVAKTTYTPPFVLMKRLTNRPPAAYFTVIPVEMAMEEPRRNRGERLQIMLDPAELALVDDFRFKKRMPSRASAVRELLKRGLAAEGFQVAAVGAKSSDYGVSGKTPEGPRVVR